METYEQALADWEDEQRDEMAAKAINDLPDDAFAFVEPGGEKDAEGKTVPRSLRHFPVHDEAHARNALARAPQSPFGDKAMPKILTACKKFGVEVSEQKTTDTQAEERDEPKSGMKVCPTCKGSGTIMAGKRTCPDCEGSGEVSATEQTSSRPRRKERRRAVPLMPEVRHWRAEEIEVRSSQKTDEIIITGSPVVFDTPYEVVDMFGKFTERMAPGVAADVLAEGADVRFLFNHDGLPLARSTSGTLSLAEGAVSLRFEARMDARQQLANDLAIAIERGDVSQMSCGFIVARDKWDDAMEDRTIFQFADLLDVSAVTYPASPSTSLQVAKRMALAMPIESRARLRKLIVDERAGKALSGANKDKVATAIGALHSLYEAGGGDPSELLENDDAVEAGEQGMSEDGSEGAGGSAGGEAPADGTLARSETIVDPGEPIRSTKTARVLAMELEARRHRRKAA